MSPYSHRLLDFYHFFFSQLGFQPHQRPGAASAMSKVSELISVAGDSRTKMGRCPANQQNDMGNLRIFKQKSSAQFFYICLICLFAITILMKCNSGNILSMG